MFAQPNLAGISDKPLIITPVAYVVLIIRVLQHRFFARLPRRTFSQTVEKHFEAINILKNGCQTASKNEAHTVANKVQFFTDSKFTYRFF